jgi:hypothetical protein
MRKRWIALGFIAVLVVVEIMAWRTVHSPIAAAPRLQIEDARIPDPHDPAAAESSPESRIPLENLPDFAQTGGDFRISGSGDSLITLTVKPGRYSVLLSCIDSVRRRGTIWSGAGSWLDPAQLRPSLPKTLTFSQAAPNLLWVQCEGQWSVNAVAR